ncbi:hypothetical protein AgCh_016324 [Apium graveolens]
MSGAAQDGGSRAKQWLRDEKDRDIDHPKSKFRFRFDNTWLKEPTFHEEIVVFWRNMPVSHLLPRLESISSFMAKWGRNFFHKFRDKIKEKKDILNNLVNCTDETSVKEYRMEKLSLDKLLEHEEAYWKQRQRHFS